MQRSERCAAAVFWRRAVLRRARQGVAPDAMRGIWARTCVLAERSGNAAAICAGRICAQAGYRAVCGGYAICGGLHSDRPSHRLKLHGNPQHVTALAGRSGRRGARYAQAESTLRRLSRRMWRLRDMRRICTQSFRRTSSSCTAIRGTYLHWQCDMADAARAMLRPNRRSGGLSRRMWRLHDLRRICTQSVRRIDSSCTAIRGTYRH